MGMLRIHLKIELVSKPSAMILMFSKFIGHQTVCILSLLILPESVQYSESSSAL